MCVLGVTCSVKRMDLSRIQVILRIEPLALRSAVRTCLESDHRLRTLCVVVAEEFLGNASDASAAAIPARTIAVDVNETPPLFVLTVAGHSQRFEYQGLDHLTAQVADVAGRFPKSTSSQQ